MSEESAILIAAAIAAFVALYVGWLHGRALDEQNKIAAFEKRYDVFDAVVESMNVAACGDRNDLLAALNRMRTAVLRSRFLFPGSVSSELQEIYKDIGVLHTEHSMRKPTDKLKAEAEAANRRIYERLKVIHSLFEPYTRLSEQRQALAWIDDALDWVEGK